MSVSLYLTACRTHLDGMNAGQSAPRHAPQATTHGFPACLERRKTMEKVIIPTVFGFASMMGLWAVVGAVI
ncbi:hypothetical protein [uncultured Tateyamaria sp.]|uniref:hypothetical protein n=1 Tax=uncultured Tateyamaria sp. TaxID=455651 RepID=UPI0026030B53|nr:hypothetical protein [uncultured Tateyamaria sp.]